MLLGSVRRFAFFFALPIALFTAACGQDGETASTGTSTSSSTTSGTGGGGTGGSGGAGTALKIADWNVHNLFDDQQESDEDVVSTKEYNDHIDAIAATLGPHDPDIIVFAEVENERALNDISDAMGNGAYTATLIPGNDTRHVHIGVLSRVPFSDVVSHKDDEFVLMGTPAPTYKYVRDCLEMHLNFGGREIVLLGIHFRSKGNPDANPPVPDDAEKRYAEAEHTRSIADGLTAADPNLALLVLGDFNDTPDSYTFKAVAREDYIDAPSLMPAAEAYTYIYNGTKELIDHQLMNPNMALLLDETSVVIPHDASVSDASDHYPIIATYRVK